MRELIRDLLAPLTELVREFPWSMPLGQGIHLLGVSLLIGAAVLLYPRLLASRREEPTAVLVARWLPWMWIAFSFIATTGLILFIAEPMRLMRSPIFKAKMILLLIALALTLFLQRRVRLPTDAPRTPDTGSIVRWVAALSLVLWFAIAASGRLIGYGQRLLPYFFG